jgi:hypothetical protein
LGYKNGILFKFCAISFKFAFLGGVELERGKPVSEDYFYNIDGVSRDELIFKMAMFHFPRPTGTL